MTYARGDDFASYQDLDTTRQSITVDHDFGFVKLTQSTNYVNPLAAGQIGLLKGAKMVYGGYHFLVAGINPVTQWDFFEIQARLYGVHLVAVDVESNQDGTTPDDATVRAFIKRGQQRGYKVGKYASLDIARKNHGEDWKWVADWGANPPSFHWDFWQYNTGKGVDRNYFNGDTVALRKFFAPHGPKPPPTPAARWWVSVGTGPALGPYRTLALTLAALAAYAVRHPGRKLYSLARS